MFVSSALRSWFVAHFVVDLVSAVPLFFFPEQVLALMGSSGPVDLVAIRLVAAAFFAIGTTSLLMRDADVSAYRVMLILKRIWSGVAIVGLVWNIYLGASHVAWLALMVFVVFGAAWTYYGRQFRNQT